MIKFKNIQMFSEQSIESVHRIVNQDLKRVTAPDEEYKLKQILRWNLEKNFIHDALCADFTMPMSAHQREKQSRLLGNLNELNINQ